MDLVTRARILVSVTCLGHDNWSLNLDVVLLVNSGPVMRVSVVLVLIVIPLLPRKLSVMPVSVDGADLVLMNVSRSVCWPVCLLVLEILDDVLVLMVLFCELLCLPVLFLGFI